MNSIMPNRTKKRLTLIVGATLLLLGAYMSAYFTYVSIEFVSSKEPNLEISVPRYPSAPFSDAFAEAFFEPARLIDATWLRPHQWQDRQHPRGNEVDIPLARIAPYDNDRQK
jgi:hypothetical protein